MADPIVVPNWGDELVEDSAATLEFQSWMSAITDAINNTPPLTGIGTPEGNEVSSVGRWYVDTNAAPADIYYKETGDGNTGWALTS